MRRAVTALAGAIVLITTAGAQALGGDTEAEVSQSGWSSAGAKVAVRNGEGNRIGTVWMRQSGARVSVSASFHSLRPGFHGFHLHETGRCEPDAPDGAFTTAGGHYTGDRLKHGNHAGDMPSLLVAGNGKARLSFTTDRFTLADLQDTDGSAVMVHQHPDNFANIPDRYSADGVSGPDETTLATGDAGLRRACGVIEPMSTS